jgi:hypothetical protein
VAITRPPTRFYTPDLFKREMAGFGSRRFRAAVLETSVGNVSIKNGNLVLTTRKPRRDCTFAPPARCPRVRISRGSTMTNVEPQSGVGSKASSQATRKYRLLFLTLAQKARDPDREQRLF